MEDPQAHQDALSIIFGREIMLLGPNETEFVWVWKIPVYFSGEV